MTYRHSHMTFQPTYGPSLPPPPHAPGLRQSCPTRALPDTTTKHGCSHRHESAAETSLERRSTRPSSAVMCHVERSLES